MFNNNVICKDFFTPPHVPLQNMCKWCCCHQSSAASSWRQNPVGKQSLLQVCFTYTVLESVHTLLYFRLLYYTNVTFIYNNKPFSVSLPIFNFMTLPLFSAHSFSLTQPPSVHAHAQDQPAQAYGPRGGRGRGGWSCNEDVPEHRQAGGGHVQRSQLQL